MQKRWISVRECAGYLGLHVKSVYRLIDRGQLPAARVCRSVRIDLRKLNEQMENKEN